MNLLKINSQPTAVNRKQAKLKVISEYNTDENYVEALISVLLSLF